VVVVIAVPEKVALNDASLTNPSKVSGPILEFELTVKLG
jgi:hypothetical protein